MKIIRTLLLLLLSGFIGFLALPVSYFLLDMPFVQSFLVAIGIPVVTSFSLLLRFIWKRVTRADPYREETAYVKHQVKEAKKKLAKISSCRFKVRSITGWVKMAKLYKQAKAIIKVVEEEPARYRELQAFFTQHLPATVTLVDRYTFLARQPVGSFEVKESLRQSEMLMEEMAGNYQRLLLNTLSQDVMTLEIEQKILKQQFQETDKVVSKKEESVKRELPSPREGVELEIPKSREGVKIETYREPVSMERTITGQREMKE